MKILLSAYACEPNKGSEPGVGWAWAIEYAKQHDVWVITRDNNDPTITEYLALHPEYAMGNLHFIYVGLPKKLTFWKKGRRGMRLFYMLWQKKAVKVAKEWNEKIHFDFVQHVTFVSYTQPSYMYKLGIPLVWGPVSGGENIPNGIKIKMSKKELVVETIRKISQRTALITPSIRETMKATKVIYAATEETKRKIANKNLNKIVIMPAIGLENMPVVHSVIHNDEKVKVIMAGRLICWKAFDIGIKAFLKVVDKYPNVELHILGEGDKKKTLQRLAGEYLDNRIFFENQVPHDQIYDFYSGFDIFMNTTLRDSGCMTMMEAMSVGIPCIAISTGGPGVLLKNDSEYAVKDRTYSDCVNHIAELLSDLIENQDKRIEEGNNQLDYVREIFLTKNKCEQIVQKLRLTI